MTVHSDFASYREQVAGALDDGWRFADLHASSDGMLLRTLYPERPGSRARSRAAMMTSPAL